MRATGSHPDQPQEASTQPEIAWLLLWLGCLVAMMLFPAWQMIPFNVLWISLALLFGIRLLPSRHVLMLTAAAAVASAPVISDDMVRHMTFATMAELMPPAVAVFAALAWQAHRRSLARDRAEIAAETQRLLNLQRQFLQDASHQLRTPITVALGHAELLAQVLSGRQQRDIRVVVGELERLKGLSEKLLIVAASENPEFLAPAPADLDLIVAETLRRWEPAAQRRWRLGRLEPTRALVDAERLGQALDALIENAVRHTGEDDEIAISVVGGDGCQAMIVVDDSGEGIAEADMPHIFDRFTSNASSGARGTGLGLALVRAIARGHGGEVTVASRVGHGSRFELALPALTAGEAGHGIPAERRGRTGGVVEREAR